MMKKDLLSLDGVTEKVADLIGTSRYERLVSSLAEAVGSVSKATKRGSGEALSAMVLSKLDSDALSRFAKSKELIYVSATNGKTTTTAMITAVLGGSDAVITNKAGNNMTAGVTFALSRAGERNLAVLEVDESHLPIVSKRAPATSYVLMNLSRDQLDRVSEVRSIAEKWRTMLASNPSARVYANVSDPHIAYVVRDHSDVVSFEVGSRWNLDATVCPICESKVDFREDIGDYHCVSCDFGKPKSSYVFMGDELYRGGKLVAIIKTSLPGNFNLMNAAVATIVGVERGISFEAIESALTTLSGVGGRYSIYKVSGRFVTAFMAKNPAGWQQIIEMLSDSTQPLIIGINANVADGKDTSWLYDIDFSPFGDREVVVVGERRYDIAVRLSYGGVSHRVVDTYGEAINSFEEGSEITYVGNYTEFSSALRYLNEVGEEIK
ncbi:MAG: MurT ligase domain-containing protein [Actinomycetota bacterium]|nr:MurT ligase domain-containing protein [Actinomycetota bacterium]